MNGTPKQIEWAEKIRAERLPQAMATLDELEADAALGKEAPLGRAWDDPRGGHPFLCQGWDARRQCGWSDAEIIRTIRAYIQAQTRAGWWIDRRKDDLVTYALGRLAIEPDKPNKFNPVQRVQ